MRLRCLHLYEFSMLSFIQFSVWRYSLIWLQINPPWSTKWSARAIRMNEWTLSLLGVILIQDLYWLLIPSIEYFMAQILGQNISIVPIHFFCSKMCFYVHQVTDDSGDLMYIKTLIASQFEKPPKSVFRGWHVTIFPRLMDELLIGAGHWGRGGKFFDLVYFSILEPSFENTIGFSCNYMHQLWIVQRVWTWLCLNKTV